MLEELIRGVALEAESKGEFRDGKRAMTTKGTSIAPRSGPEDASDLLGAYLAEIGRHELLTAGEEVELARLVQRGVEAGERLARGETNGSDELRRAVEEGRDAKDRFVRSNLRLVVSVARKYARGRVEMLDLVQEGNVGLMRAVERFDPERGFRFSTYATWWIRQAIAPAVSQNVATIRVPEHVRGRLRRLRGAQESLRTKLGREPSLREAANAAGLAMEEAGDLQGLPDAVSFETPVGEAGGSELGDFLADEELPSPLDPLIAAGMQADVRAGLETLSERERRLLELRFGLEDGSRHTLEQIAEDLGVSRQRVRQIEQRALARLREAQAGRLEAYA